MPNVDTQKLEDLTRRVVAGLGYDLVDLEWKHEAGHWILRVYLDWPELSACTELPSWAFGQMLAADAHDVHGTYRVAA